MFNKFHFLLLPVLFCTTLLQAQNNPLETYDKEGIYLKTELFRGTVFVKGKTVRPVGFAFKHLRPEFEKTPEVMPMFKKAQRNQKISFAVGIIGLAGVTTGLLMSLKSVDNQGYLINERQYKQGVNLVLGSALVSTVLNIPLNIKSRQQLDDAIWLRNRTLLGQ